MEAAVRGGYSGEGPFKLKPAANLFAGEADDAAPPPRPAAKRTP
jgi:hypothetical protein